MNRDVRRVGHEPSLGIEHRAREVEAVANVGAHRRALEHHTHLLRDRLELVVEDLEENGVDAGVGSLPSGVGFGVLENEVVALVAKRDEACIDNHRSGSVQYQRGPGNLLPNREALAVIDRRFDQCPT